MQWHNSGAHWGVQGMLMGELSFWERIRFTLMTPFRWIQCCAPTKADIRGTFEYCVRHKGHFGKHRTYCGKDFTSSAEG